MKKLIVMCLCLLLCGCEFLGKPSLPYGDTTEEKIELIGEYVNDDLILTLRKHQSGKLEFYFEFISTGIGINEFARFVDSQQKEAIYDKQDDGYILTFSIQEDKVTVKETGGESFLYTDLSGEYVKE